MPLWAITLGEFRPQKDSNTCLDTVLKDFRLSAKPFTILTYRVIHIQVVSIVGIDRGYRVYSDQWVLNVSRLVLGPDVCRTLPEPWTTLHACQENATF